MNSAKQILVILVGLLLYAPPVVAQEPQLAKTSREVTIIIQQQQLRFAAPASAQEVRLEVFNQAGEMIYDSSLVSGAELSWALQNSSGEAITSGLYAYTLTVKEANVETPRLRRGHLIVERGRDREPQTDRLWVTSQGSVGAEAAISGGELTVSSGPETSVAGARIGRAGAARSTLNLDFFGTPGRIPMFTGSDFLADSVILQDFNGRIGIGTQRPGTALLTVAGQIETTSGGIKFPNGTVQTTSAAGALFQVNRDATLMGNGTGVAPLGIANGGVTGPKIASGQVVKSLNGLFDNVSLMAGSNITITPSGNSLNIAAPNQLGSVTHDSTLVGNGTGAMPLGVAAPLSLNGSSGFPILEIFNNGIGDGVRARGGDINSDSDFAGNGVTGVGGDTNTGFGGAGVTGLGGDSSRFAGGFGVMGKGGGTRNGGIGVVAIGGDGTVGGRGGTGLVAVAGSGPGAFLAGRFDGDVDILGTLAKLAGSFKIDHPLDPANKYLSHSFVESPDMMNIYNGNITTDQSGEATVTLPDYFESLNRDFRYQLTVIGRFAQAIVGSEISGASFTIKTDRPGVKVSWQVTGIRQDAYANKHRIPVEEEKPERERGYYLQPEVFNQPEEKSVEWARNPEMMKQMKESRLKPDRRVEAKSPKQ